MSVTEGFFVLESENSLVREKPKVVKTAKSTFGSAARKKLGDISNLPQRPKSLVQDEKEQFVSNTTKEFIEKLQKENMALMKLLADRNKIIELSGFELQSLRINLQKVQQQNLQLAQANSQMLVELNFGKDRIKALQHELGCRNGLLKARELEFEVGTSKSEEAIKSSEADRADNKRCDTSKQQQSESRCVILSTVQQTQLNEKTENRRVSLRRQSARFKFEKPDSTEDKFEAAARTPDKARDSSEPDRANNLQKSKSLDPSTVKQAQLKEKPENKRISLRRESARFKSENPEPSGDKIEVSNSKLPEWSVNYDTIREVDKGASIAPRDGGATELQRTSIGRPLRLAAKKVQSYKEIPVNVKLRRTA